MILSIIVFIFLASSYSTQSVPPTLSSPRLPSNTQTLNSPTSNETANLALASPKPITLSQPTQTPTNDSSDWPSTPITRFLSRNNYLVISLLGTHAPTSLKPSILSSINAIVLTITLEGSPSGLIDAPYRRTSGIVTVVFGNTIHAIMTREEVIRVLSTVWELTRMYTPREISESYFGLGHARLVDWNMTFDAGVGR